MLANVHVSWTALVLALATAVAALFLRRLMPIHERHRGKWPILFLIVSVLLRVLGVGLDGAELPAWHRGINLASAICLAFGMSGVIGMLIFEVVLARLGFRVPMTLRDILVGIGFVVALMILVRYSGANLVGLVTTSAVLTAVIGLALQEPIANVFAGLSLQFDKTLSVGDWIKFGDRIGRIEKIGFRAATLSTRDDDSITVPNRYFMQHEVMNYSRPTSQHRMWCEVQFGYQTPPNVVKRAMLDAVVGVPGVLDNPPPSVIVRDFEDSGVNYVVLYYIEDFGRDVYIESDVRTRIWYAAQRHGLEMPYPTRTVHMHQVTEESARVADERGFMDRLGALAKIDLFAALGDADVDLLARGMRRHEFSAGETIIRQGDAGDSCFLVTVGKVAVTVGLNGAQRQVAELGPGQIIGEASLMTGDPRGATCVAHSDVVTYVVSHDLFKTLLAGKPELAEDLSVVLSERQTKLEAEREGLSADATAARQAEMRKKTLHRIRQFFHLG